MKTNILIIGGGIIGLSTAWKLAKQGKSVTVLERDACNKGASIVAPGALMPYHPSRIDELPTMQRKSLAMYPKLIKELEAETCIDVKYTQNGRLQQIQSINHLQKIQEDVDYAVANWPKVNNKLPMEILNAEQLKKREPNLIATEFGTLYCRTSGHIHSPLLMKALYEACIKNGVEILENTKVTDIKAENNHVTSVETENETFTADNTIITAGAWSSKIFDTPIEIKPVKGQVIAVKTPDPLLGKSFIRAKGLYILQATPTTLIIGATKEYDAGFDVTPTEDASREMFKKACSVVPKLAEYSVAHAFCGLRPMSKVTMPFMDRIPEYDNLYMSCGHGGIGICMMPVASQILADKLIG
jgi:glycine oxidase